MTRETHALACSHLRRFDCKSLRDRLQFLAKNEQPLAPAHWRRITDSTTQAHMHGTHYVYSSLTQESTWRPSKVFV